MGVERRTVSVWKTASEVHTAQSDQCFPLSIPLREKSKKNLKKLIDKTKYLIKRISREKCLVTFSGSKVNCGISLYGHKYYFDYFALYRESTSIPLQKAGTN